MKCKNIKGKFADFLINDLDDTFKKEVQSHLKSCTACREELESLSETWTKLEVLPEEHPSNGLRTRFYSMLEDYKKSLKHERKPSFLNRLIDAWHSSWWLRRPAFQAAFTLLVLMVGLAIGYILNLNGQSKAELARIRQEVQGMRQTLAVSLLDQSSPSERLKGISLSYQVENPDKKTIVALLETLNSDPNVNVRLAAVDALYLFYGNPDVKEGLIHSLSKQSSPLVQVALIDLIITMHERRSIEALKTLIQDEKLNPDVKQRAEQGIQQLGF